MNKPQITIKDIARALNVSPSTVSRALKDNPDISKETRNLIHAYAQEHNYKPNALAINLRVSRSNTIGVIVPQLVHHFFSCVLSGLFIHFCLRVSVELLHRLPRKHFTMNITRNF